MTRLIDANKAERDIEELRKSNWFNAPYLSKERKIGLSEAFDMIQGVCIKHAPTVDAVPVRHGTWRHYEHMLTCSVCGTVFYDDIMEYFGEEVPKYCPECGAKMDL